MSNRQRFSWCVLYLLILFFFRYRVVNYFGSHSNFELLLHCFNACYIVFMHYRSYISIDVAVTQFSLALAFGSKVEATSCQKAQGVVYGVKRWVMVQQKLHTTIPISSNSSILGLSRFLNCCNISIYLTLDWCYFRCWFKSKVKVMRWHAFHVINGFCGYVLHYLSVLCVIWPLLLLPCIYLFNHCLCYFLFLVSVAVWSAT
jgi:hypothetical protein